jgi:hypothetical protein
MTGNPLFECGPECPAPDHHGSGPRVQGQTTPTAHVEIASDGPGQIYVGESRVQAGAPVGQTGQAGQPALPPALNAVLTSLVLTAVAPGQIYVGESRVQADAPVYGPAAPTEADCAWATASTTAAMSDPECWFGTRQAYAEAEAATYAAAYHLGLDESAPEPPDPEAEA